MGGSSVPSIAISSLQILNNTLPSMVATAPGGSVKPKFFDGDPEVWKVVDGKLYVNYNREIEKSWEQDISGFIKTADQTWPTLEK